jgi:hypothetical protein
MGWLRRKTEEEGGQEEPLNSANARYWKIVKLSWLLKAWEVITTT